MTDPLSHVPRHAGAAFSLVTPRARGVSSAGATPFRRGGSCLTDDLRRPSLLYRRAPEGRAPVGVCDPDTVCLLTHKICNKYPVGRVRNLQKFERPFKSERRLRAYFSCQGTLGRTATSAGTAGAPRGAHNGSTLRPRPDFVHGRDLAHFVTRPSARGKAPRWSPERPPCTRHPNPTVPPVLLPRAHPRLLCSSGFCRSVCGRARLAPQRRPQGRPHSSLLLALPVAVFTARDDSISAFRAARVRLEQLHLWRRRVG